MGIISTRRALSCPVMPCPCRLKTGMRCLSLCCLCVCVLRCAVRRFLPLCTSISTSFPPVFHFFSSPPPFPISIPAKSRDRPSLLSRCWPTSRAGNQNGFCLPAQPLSQHLDGIKHRSPMSDAMQCHAICHVMSCRWMTRFYWTTFIFIT